MGKHNLFFHLGKLVCLAFMVVAASVASASPTITRHGTDLSVSSPPATIRTATVDSISTIVNPAHAELADIGKEILSPLAASAGLPNVGSNSVRLLPGAPAAVLMLLAGFLCVSLYRDRRVWLFGLMGLFGICQAGIQTLPRLAHHCSHNSHTKQRIGAQLTCSSHLGRFRRSRSDIEGTRYTGLLRHLGGIPDSKRTIHSYTSQPALICDNSFTLNFRCLASEAEQFSCFSPASIFETIPRGPPALA